MARLEAIRMFLAFAAHSNIKVYQMYVKSAFLNEELEEEVYVEQPLGFEDSKFSDFVYFLFKAPYGLKQAPHTWYVTLSEFLLENGFTRGVIDKTIFFKMHKNDMILVQVYVGDIIFGSTNDQLCSRFAKLMQSKYKMSMMGELKYFLSLPRVIYQNHLPKECHLFFTIISHVFAPKISGFLGISKMIQIIGFSIAHNRRINFGHLMKEEIIKNQQSARETYCMYPRFLQIALEHMLTEAQQGIYTISRLIEPSVLSLRPAMVLFKNANYPIVVLPARVTVHIQELFNSLDLVAAVEQVSSEGGHEGGDDEDNDSSTTQSESLDLDQTGTSGLQKSPEISNTPEAEYVPGQEVVNQIHGDILNFDLSEFFGSEYLSFLDSSEPTQLSFSEPSMDVDTCNESGNPPVLTHAEEQQTHSSFTPLPLKRKILL